MKIVRSEYLWREKKINTEWSFCCYVFYCNQLFKDLLRKRLYLHISFNNHLSIINTFSSSLNIVLDLHAVTLLKFVSLSILWTSFFLLFFAMHSRQKKLLSTITAIYIFQGYNIFHLYNTGELNVSQHT